MKAIILAAGKDNNIGNEFEGLPKCLVTIEGQSLLEIQINTLHSCGIDEIIVVRGYKKENINIPGIKYYDNNNYLFTNMLHSLFCAKDELNGECLILYSDIIYEEQVIKKFLDATYDISIGTTVKWEEAHSHRNKLLLEQLEMVHFDSENRVKKIGKMPYEEYQTQGQFIGIVKLSSYGSEILKRNYDILYKLYSKKIFVRSEKFEKAWITDLLQIMSNLGVPIYCVIIERGWIEIDTYEDYERAVNDTNFVRRLVKINTDWDHRAKFYNKLKWVNKDVLLNSIVKVAGDLTNKKILDVGTGTGKILISLYKKYPNAGYTGIDISKSMLAKINTSYNFNLYKMKMENLSEFNNNYFDLVISRMAFHHSIDIDKSTSEVYRVLKKGGKFILCEGNPPSYKCLAFYNEMFRFKEDRLTFLESDMINLFIKHSFKDITTKSLVMKKMSLNNWLDNSGLPFRNIDIIKKLHYSCDSNIKKAYNMKVLENDILMDWKFSIVMGVK